jgi:DNA helicase-2/ATP-dependent DNA helicase PcrA
MDAILGALNPQQRAAARYQGGPLLIVAGAGTGKTTTLVHRLAYLLACGEDPSRTLLLTFTRRAAAEMLRRVDAVFPKDTRGRALSERVWGGTFHSVATRLLRMYGKPIGLDPNFTIHDRSDSEDLLNVVRTELNLAKSDKRFPKKGTCMDIYSRCVNSRQSLEAVLDAAFPWCDEYADDLKRLFKAYVDRKEKLSVLDYDDLLLYWHGLLSDPSVGDRVRSRFNCVLVDEYQDTNRLQAEILKRLRPDGAGLTAVGDDAQSIYSFRAATVRNILDFPKEFPGAKIIALEENFRSTQPILRATNRVIAEAEERYVKELWSKREEGAEPHLVTCLDEDEQCWFLVRTILEHREGGVDLRRQAVLFRASHHSIVLEAELTRRRIPFVKFGGLRFIETAHVKDVLAFLRLAENHRDVIAGLRVLTLLPGIGPKKAQQLCAALVESGGVFSVWADMRPPDAAATVWPKFVKLMVSLREGRDTIQQQVRKVRKFYAPLLENKYDHAPARSRDLEQIENLATRFKDRAAMLAEITLDPPNSSEDFAGPPHLDDDYLILSTMHSAKGLEWDVVYVIHASDGNIPSDLATGDADQIEEERRLFYVALTRAKNWVYVCCPQRYYFAYGRGKGDPYGYAQLTRFLSRRVIPCFRRVDAGTCEPTDETQANGRAAMLVRRRLKSLWS